MADINNDLSPQIHAILCTILVFAYLLTDYIIYTIDLKKQFNTYSWYP